MSKITDDSRKIGKDDIFVAIKGFKSNGEDFIESAICKGAKAIVVSSDSKIQNLSSSDVELIRVSNLRQYLAKQVYANAKQPEDIVAITGTNGKTSTAFFYKQICSILGKKSACIGTMGVKADGCDFGETLTSPDPVHMGSILEELSIRGVQCIAIEASSHGLSQYRIDGMNIKGAAFTGFSHDHLDYHSSIDEYFNAKARLFSEVLPQAKGEFAVLNSDMKEFDKLLDICKVNNIRVFDYGKNAEYMSIKHHSDGGYNILFKGCEYYLDIQFINAEFHAYNLACSMILAMHTAGFEIEGILSIIPQLKVADGRLEKVRSHNSADIYIDYAHTPDALEKVLLSLRGVCSGKLYLVFGCGGDRDKTKRPAMGEIANKFADVVIITNDNPRSEDPEIIADEILFKCKKALKILDRKDAITEGVSMLQEGDVLLVCGKGHEKYQIIGSTKHYFSDKEEILALLS